MASNNQRLRAVISFPVETKALPLTKTAKHKFVALLEEFANGVLAKAEGSTIMDGKPAIVSAEITGSFQMGCEGHVKIKQIPALSDEWGAVEGNEE